MPVDMEIKDRFSELWRKYFRNAELPITFYYSQREGSAELVKPGSLARCLIGALGKVRKGRSLAFGAHSVGCAGGRRYLGFTRGIMRNFEYFLSCGIPGKMEGERYKKSPKLVKEVMKNWPNFKAPAPFVIFKRWDNLEKEDNPEVVIFFAQDDVLAGLFTLANFDQAKPEGAFAPMGSGCSSIVSYPYLEKDSPNPRAVIGMFDISARPYLQKDMLSFSMPMAKLITMMDNMEDSFLITDSWKKLQKRIS
jgi:uncharacterized protein (DUF169 family)